MLLFQFTNQHLNLYSCKEWCFDCRCPIEIPLQNCFNLIRRKSRQCFNISIEIFRHNHSDTMIFFITHFRWCVCNYLSNCNNSSWSTDSLHPSVLHLRETPRYCSPSLSQYSISLHFLSASILHFRFGLAVLKFVSPDFERKK